MKRQVKKFEIEDLSERQIARIHELARILRANAESERKEVRPVIERPIPVINNAYGFRFTVSANTESAGASPMDIDEPDRTPPLPQAKRKKYEYSGS